METLHEMVECSVEVLDSANERVKSVAPETFSKVLSIIIVKQIFYICSHQSKFYLKQILCRKKETNIYSDKVHNILY